MQVYPIQINTLHISRDISNVFYSIKKTLRKQAAFCNNRSKTSMVSLTLKMKDKNW